MFKAKLILCIGCSYAIGTMVWTLFDYYGEPSFGGWPFVSSTFGAFDLTGFAKAASYWFRSQWLYSVPDGHSVCWADTVLMRRHDICCTGTDTNIDANTYTKT